MGQPEIRSVNGVSAGDIWSAIITGVRHVHSLIIEAWGANGGITRIFPQGQDQVKVELRFLAPGRTTLSLTLRDDRLGGTHAFETAVDVTPAGVRPAYAMEQSWRGPMGGRLDTTTQPPPFQLLSSAAPHAYRDTSRPLGFGNIIGPAIAALGDRIKLQFSLPERGLTVKFYASNAVVDFVGPMPVEEVTAETGVQMTEEGTATVWGEAFDKLGNLAAKASHAIQVHAPKRDERPASSGRPLGFGNIIGPAFAELGERIRLSFSLPEPGLTVKFYAQNAVVDFVGPMPVEEVSAETGVQMTEEGTATVWGEAFDKIGNLAAKASHMIQVHAPKRNDRPSGSRPLGFGNIIGPAIAALGDRIKLQFSLPEPGLTVKFYAQNAVVDFVGPMPVEEITAETGVQMTEEGTATVWGEAFDKLGNLAAKASHAIQVHAPKREDTPLDNSLNNLAADMQRSLEQSIRARLNKS